MDHFSSCGAATVAAALWVVSCAGSKFSSEQQTGAAGATGGLAQVSGSAGQDSVGGMGTTLNTETQAGTSTVGGASSWSGGGTQSNFGGDTSIGGATSQSGTAAIGGQPAITLSFGERDYASCSGLTLDTDINSGEPDLNYGLAELFGCDTNPLRIGLLRFGLENCSDQIGTLNRVLSARLHLHTGACAGCQASPSTTIQIFELLESWQEGDGPSTGEAGYANWTERDYNQLWSGAGADVPSRGTTVIGELRPTSADTDYVVALPIDVVQRWVNQSDANFGVALVIKSIATNPTDGVSFGASDGDISISPLLEIDFAPPTN